MSYCKSNVPWNGNPGTRCHRHRKPRPRRLSTPLDLCERGKHVSFDFSFLILTCRSISDNGRTNFYGQTANSYVGSSLQVCSRFVILRHSSKVPTTGQIPSSSGEPSEPKTYPFRTKQAAKRMMTSCRRPPLSSQCQIPCRGGVMHFPSHRM